MVRLVRFPMVFALSALFVVLAVGVVAAQDAATPFAGRETPDPARCVVAPRSSNILTPAATAVATTGPATPTAATEPAGQSVSPATQGEITAAIRELYACLNKGNPLQTLALFTDAAAARFVADHPELGANGLVATPTAVANGIALIAIADLRLLPDGRVFALVTQDDPNQPPDGPEPVFLTFAKQGNRWLVDEMQVLAAGSATS